MPLTKRELAAIRHAINDAGREAFAHRHGINPRTVERLYAGKLPDAARRILAEQSA